MQTWTQDDRDRLRQICDWVRDHPEEVAADAPNTLIELVGVLDRLRVPEHYGNTPNVLARPDNMN